jgi:uncharacterized protein YutE (UPF0331/DUF86 family)
MGKSFRSSSSPGSLPYSQISNDSADRSLPAPEVNRDTFTVLEKAGELSPDLAERLRGWAGFRNILVHEYLPIDHSIAYRAIRDELRDLESFVSWALGKLAAS